MKNIALAARTSDFDVNAVRRHFPVLARNVQINRLAATINDMLDRITRLMDGVRQVSNAIAPDHTVTPGARGNRSGPVDPAAWPRHTPEQEDAWARLIPLGPSDQLEARFDGQVGVGERLRFDPLRGVDDKHRALAGRKRP